MHLETRMRELGFIPIDHEGKTGYLPPIQVIPQGEFIMGSDPVQDSQSLYNEYPQQRVYLDAFALGRYPITVAEYMCAVEANALPPPRTLDDGVNMIFMDWNTQLQHTDHPVLVNWESALEYVHWLQLITGIAWRFPTEAEWEKAARGPQGNLYPWGNSWHDNYAHWSGTTPSNMTTSPVNAYPQGRSIYGNYDMVGNVWEYTSTTYRQYPYDANDGRENLSSDEPVVVRGGSFISDRSTLRCAAREEFLLDAYQGFRIALSVENAQ